MSAPGWSAPPVAVAQLDPSAVVWQLASSDVDLVDLTIAGPSDFRIEKRVAASEAIRVGLAALAGDGLYVYELVAHPRAGNADARAVRQSGSFRVQGGAIVVPQDASLGGDRPTEDNILGDDLIVQGTVCIGVPCLGGERADATVLRLKENALRMDFDDTSVDASFPSNDWALVANDVTSGGADYFAIEDATTNRQVVRIDAGAPADALRVDSTGNVGIGTATPDALLTVASSTGDAHIHVLETDSTATTRELLTIENHGRVRLGMQNSSLAKGTAGSKWIFDLNNGGNFSLIDLSDATVEMLLNNNGNMTIGGTLTQNSDRSTKTDIEAVDPSQVLDRVLTLPISTWTFIEGEPGVQHLGPMAQDFYALFGLGEKATQIATIDVAGVALAAIQGLDAKQRAEIERLKMENADLSARLAALEAKMLALAADD
ncbi:MAG: tail fiber domain-containing protein [Acidobacteriota bacterium]